MTTIPKVLLLLDCETKELTKSAQDICATLSTKFGLTNVSVRSASVPMDRLLTNHEDPPSLLVYLGNSSSPGTIKGHALIAALERESSIPILQLKIGNNNDGSSTLSSSSLQIAKWCGLASSQVRQLVQQACRGTRQARLVNDAQLHTKSPRCANALSSCYDDNHQVTGDTVIVNNGKAAVVRARGKVRDRYDAGTNKLALVTTDRQSGFDRMLASVPFKGAVLNMTSAFWFQKTQHIIKNHLLQVPHPYVSIVKKCKPFPIEFVVRSYMTGSTSTSIWKNYSNGLRNCCGHDLPEGMIKNQKLWANILTPTTKEEDHDRPISAKDVVAEGWMTQEDWDVCASAALKVFALGQEVATERGLILVDTKFEFGRDEATKEILLIDEVLTPDSSRYWLASTYQDKMAAGEEPDNIDKEFLRLWFRDNCDPYNDDVLPKAPRDLVLELSRRYILLYEMITWKDFDFEQSGGEEAIGKAIESHL